MLIRTPSDVDAHMATIEAAASRSLEWFARQLDDPMALLRNVKFAPVGFHPIGGHPLNFIEQINQTWTFLAALAATKKLLELHPEADGFKLAPGAHVAQDLDIMSNVPGLVGAETFAAVHPSNNRKLASDLSKLAARTERHRYVFFMSPAFPGTRHLSELDRDGVTVWSVDVEGGRRSN